MPEPTVDDVLKAFFELIGTGRIDRVRTALDAAPQLVHAVGPHPFWGGRPQALHVAIEGQRRDMCDLLLERGADVNGRNDQYDHWSPLMLAIDRENADMHEQLLRRGAGERGTPLVRHMIARGIPAMPKEYARLGDIETLEAMIEKDPGVARLDSVLMAAVDFRHCALVERLLAHGADVNARADAQSRQTVLHSAAWNGDLRMVQMLIASGADPTLRDEQYDGTALGWAEISRDVTNNPLCTEVADYMRTLLP